MKTPIQLNLFFVRKLLKNKAEKPHKNNLETWLANVNMIKVPNEQKNKLIC